MPVRQYGRRGVLIVITKNDTDDVVCIGHASDPREFDEWCRATAEVRELTYGDRPRDCTVCTKNVDGLARELRMEHEDDAGEIIRAYIEKGCLKKQEERAAALVA
jgi:hypothetical protein